MRSDWIISAGAHAAILVFGLVTLASSKPSTDASNFMPISIVTSDDLSQATPGQQNAPKLEKAKPLADKVGDPKPVKELAPKVADKPEIKTESAVPAAQESKPETKTEPKPVEKTEKPKEPKTKTDAIAQELNKDEAKKPPKPEKKAEKKPEKKPPAFKPDQIAEELKKDEARKEKPRKDMRPTPKFDANEVAALLDHREPQRQLAAAATLNDAASLGAANGHAAVLSQSELDALRAKLISLWNPPAAVSTNPDQYIVTIHIRLTRDYRLAGPPDVMTNGEGPLFEATRESAIRAVLQAQPYDMLSQSTYDQWKDITVTFNPREVFGG